MTSPTLGTSSPADGLGTQTGSLLGTPVLSTVGTGTVVSGACPPCHATPRSSFTTTRPASSGVHLGAASRQHRLPASWSGAVATESAVMLASYPTWSRARLSMARDGARRGALRFSICSGSGRSGLGARLDRCATPKLRSYRGQIHQGALRGVKDARSRWHIRPSHGSCPSDCCAALK